MPKGGKDDQTLKILKGGSTHQRNTLESLLNRSIKFRKSRYVDEKLELFKKKYAPINAVGDDRLNQSNGNASTLLDTLAGTMDANGFEHPGKILFDKEKINPNWSTIRPIGAGLSVDLANTSSSLNSVLQILTYTPAMSNYLLSRWHGNNCAVQDHCFVCTLENHVSLCMKQAGGVITPRQFIGKVKHISKGSCLDAYIVWRYFMDQIQSGLLLEKGSKDERIKQTTALHQIFGGFVQNHFVCSGCQKAGNTYDAFLELSLDIDATNTVEKCLSQMTHEKLVKAFVCPSCENTCSGKRTKTIYRTPTVLALRLNRFQQNGKNDKMVRFEETLNIKRYVSESERSMVETQYHLYGLITHEGASSRSGQYTAYAKSSNGLWHCFENESVQQISTKRLMAQNPYMLFYTVAVAKKTGAKSATEVLKPAKAAVEKEKSVIEQQEENESMSESGDEVVEPVSDEDTDDEEQKTKLDQILKKAAAEPIADNEKAVVVKHDEPMESKWSKLETLIEREKDDNSSAQAKEILLSKSDNVQFQDNIDRWEEEGNHPGIDEKQRQQALKNTKSKRKRPNLYDVDYDRGKVKKVKKKSMDKFFQPNVFQIAAESMQKKK
ncbi:hypothetical protein BX666DRAFT_2024372 [Dichotomocladium elegans]|nr:hypothetical protein BX666DRAFT_2024372 [Dichotomocladium elegans]